MSFYWAVDHQDSAYPAGYHGHMIVIINESILLKRCDSSFVFSWNVGEDESSMFKNKMKKICKYI